MVPPHELYQLRNQIRRGRSQYLGLNEGRKKKPNVAEEKPKEKVKFVAQPDKANTEIIKSFVANK